MTSVSSFVNPVISDLARGLVRESFGEVLIVGKHDAWGERYREYDAGPALQNIVADGIAATDPIYKTANSILAQTPKISKLIIGRLVDDFDHTFELTVQTTVTVGDVYSFNVRSPAGVVTPISYTAQSGDTATLVAAALQALVTAISGLTATSSTPVIACSADNSNEMWQIEDLNPQQIWFEDTTVDSTLATEIGQINTLYDSWYGLALADCPSAARIAVVAAYVETLEKMFFATSFDTENTDGTSTTCIRYTLNAAQYDRTVLGVSNDQNARMAAGIMGARFPYDAGSQTWCFKSISGVTADTWTATQTSGITTQKGNAYIQIAQNLFWFINGTVASGEWIDVIRGRDWYVSEIRTALINLLNSNAKIPHTDPGYAMVKKEIEAVQQRGIAQGFLAANPAPFCTVPLAANVSDADKIARVLPDVYAEATLAGAIHYITPITLVVKV